MTSPSPSGPPPSDPPPIQQSPRSGERWLLALAGLILVTVVVSELFAPALPGWRSGIGGLIAASDRTASVLSQVVAASGALTAFRLLLRSLWESRLSIAYRLGTAPLVAAVVTTVIAAATRELSPLLILGLSVFSAMFALMASVPAVLTAATRGIGMCLGLTGLAAMVGAGARFFALRASHEALASLFAIARAFMTLSLIPLVIAWAIGLIWLAKRNHRRALLWMGCSLAVGAVAAAIAWWGAQPDAPQAATLVTRMLGAVSRHPLPLLPAPIRHALEAMLLSACALLLFVPGRHRLERAALLLTLLPRGATDIPILALSCVLAALAAPLATAEARGSSALPSHNQRRTPESHPEPTAAAK